MRDATDKFRASPTWQVIQTRLAAAEKRKAETLDGSTPLEDRLAIARAVMAAKSAVAAGEERAVLSDPLVQLAAARLKKAEEEVAKLPPTTPTPKQMQEKYPFLHEYIAATRPPNIHLHEQAREWDTISHERIADWAKAWLIGREFYVRGIMVKGEGGFDQVFNDNNEQIGVRATIAFEYQVVGTLRRENLYIAYGSEDSAFGQGRILLSAVLKFDAVKGKETASTRKDELIFKGTVNAVSPGTLTIQGQKHGLLLIRLKDVKIYLDPSCARY